MSQAGANSNTGGGSVISAPDHSVLLGTGSSSVGSTGPGATGTVLIGNGASADPSFSATPSVTSITIANAPVVGTDGTNKTYVDSVAMGLNIQASCYAGSTSNLTAAYANGAAGVGATLTNSGALAAFSIDGTSPPINSRILVKDQSSNVQNGIYTLTTIGSGAVAWVLTRATDYDTPAEIQPGDLVVVQNGTVNATTSWIQLDTVTTIGTDPIQFTQFTANPSLFVKSLTGNSGGAITPSSGNINIIGTGGVTVTGAGNSLTISSASFYSVTFVSSNYTILSTDQFVSVDTTSGPVTVKLPDTPFNGQFFTIKDINGTAATNNITVTTVSGVLLIDGSTSYIMNVNLQSIQVIFDGFGYEVF